MITFPDLHGKLHYGTADSQSNVYQFDLTFIRHELNSIDRIENWKTELNFLKLLLSVGWIILGFDPHFSALFYRLFEKIIHRLIDNEKHK